MPQNRIEDEDRHLEAERRDKYRGTARIRLEWLQFHSGERRELDRRNVERLKTIFRKDCRRQDVHNHIQALVEQQHLDVALRISGVERGELLSHPPPELVFPPGYQLECLHGQHRIQAGKEVLSPEERWWTVELYTSDVSRKLKTYLVEECSNEEKPNDGEIYRKIRQYHSENNSTFERRWWTRLTPHRRNNLKRLFRHHELTAAFDALLDIPGLWGGMRISTLHKLMSIRCDEEILCYLDHIKRVWHTLLQGNKALMSQVDQATVQALELTAPQASRLDAQALRGQILSGTIFSAFTEAEREGVWARLRKVEGLIPSLFTLFEDLKMLEAYADCVKRLTHLPPRKTLSSTLQSIFVTNEERRQEVQVTESEFVSRFVSCHDQVELACRQLYAFAMRYSYDMPKELSGKNLLARPKLKADENVLSAFADLAHRLGFVSPEITSLRRGRSLSYSPNRSKPLLVTDGPGESKKHRCGLPRSEDYEADREFLFIDNLHDTSKEQGDSITSFFVRKSVYSRFYGTASPSLLASNSRPDPNASLRSVQYNDHMDLDGVENAQATDLGTVQEQAREQEVERVQEVEQEQEVEQARQRLEEEAQRQEVEQGWREEGAQRQEVEQWLQEEGAQRQQVEQEPQEREPDEYDRAERQILGEEDLFEDEPSGESLGQGDDRSPTGEGFRAQNRVTQVDLQRVRGIGNGLVEAHASPALRVTEASPASQPHGETQSSSPTKPQSKTYIKIKLLEGTSWKDIQEVDGSDPRQVERLANEFVRKGKRLMDTQLGLLRPGNCLEVVQADGTNTILLVDGFEITDELRESALAIRREALKKRKRVSTDNVSGSANKRHQFTPRTVVRRRLQPRTKFLRLPVVKRNL